MNRFRIRLVGPDTADDGQPGYRVNVYDRTCVVDSTAWEVGADYYCRYGHTVLEALRAAISDVYDGTAEKYFDSEREYYGADWTTPFVPQPPRRSSRY
jgi:hypothetical protein